MSACSFHDCGVLYLECRPGCAGCGELCVGGVAMIAFEKSSEMAVEAA